MYRILVVDDEPAAGNHIVNIVKKKCEAFEVSALAHDGEQALEMLEMDGADIVITDVKMPVMDGIRLSGKIKDLYPDKLVIVVSGYQEFEYAKGALKNGVVDYLLKPVKPQTLKELLDKIKERLDILYCRRRNEVLGSMCNGRGIPVGTEMEQLFPEEQYYLALLHINALEHGASKGKTMEMLTMEGEQMYCYGRNERELLVVCPHSLLCRMSFREIIEKQLGRFGDDYQPCVQGEMRKQGIEEREGHGFYTVVYSDGTHSWKEFPGLIKELYQILERSVCIGLSQLIVLEDGHFSKNKENCFERMEQMVQSSGRGKLSNQLRDLFKVWEKEHCAQLWVESQLRYLLCLFFKYGFLEGSIEETTIVLEDIITNAFTLKEVCESVLAMLESGTDNAGMSGVVDKEILFEKIKKYIFFHLSEELTVQRICREFALSQTSLGKLFRTYGGCSFNTYLTSVRIEQAKKIMVEEQDLFIRDVAERTGYKDQFYFSRIFRAVTGVSPSDFMNGTGER